MAIFLPYQLLPDYKKKPFGGLDLVKLACTHEKLTSKGDLAREPVKHQKFSLTVLKDT